MDWITPELVSAAAVILGAVLTAFKAPAWVAVAVDRAAHIAALYVEQEKKNGGSLEGNVAKGLAMSIARAELPTVARLTPGVDERLGRGIEAVVGAINAGKARTP